MGTSAWSVLGHCAPLSVTTLHAPVPSSNQTGHASAPASPASCSAFQARLGRWLRATTAAVAPAARVAQRPLQATTSRRRSARAAGAAGAAALSLALALGGPGPACAAALRQPELPPIPTVFPPLPDLKAPKLEVVVLANGALAWPACAAKTRRLAPHGRPAHDSALLLQACGCS